MTEGYRATESVTVTVSGSTVHDLKNVFAVLLGHAQLVLAADDRGERPGRESLEAVQRAATNGLELTQQLLQGARSAPAPVHRVDAGALLRRLASTARTALGRQHQVHVEPGPEHFELLADEARLERAVVDLLLNARDALPASGGTVQLCFRSVELTSGYRVPGSPELSPGTYGMVDVVDDGTGMAPDVLERVTDPFFTTKGLDGSGVGLHSVARFVETAGGVLQLDSAPGVGTRVRLVLPGRTRDAPPADTPRPTRPPRALLHGSDRALLSALGTALRHRGIEAVTIVDPEAAVVAVGTGSVAVLVIDDRDVGGDAHLLRTAASTSTPVLGLAGIDVPARPATESWLRAVADDVDVLLEPRPSSPRC